MTVIDQERLAVGTLPIWVHNEHKARWRFASIFVEGKIVADCACGTGLGSKMFASSGAAAVHAFDLSDDAIAATREACSQLENVSIKQSNGCELPLESNSIDLFVSFETIEHITTDKDFLSEVVRVLNPAGTFICSTPNRSVTMPGKELTDIPWNPFHVREYNQPEFLNLLQQYFEDVNLRGQNPKSAWRVSVLEIIGRILPGHLGGRINSALKLPRFLFDKEEHHAVVDMPKSGTCEYLVAVCGKPK